MTIGLRRRQDTAGQPRCRRREEMDEERFEGACSLRDEVYASAQGLYGCRTVARRHVDEAMAIWCKIILTAEAIDAVPG